MRCPYLSQEGILLPRSRQACLDLALDGCGGVSRGAQSSRRGPWPGAAGLAGGSRAPRDFDRAAVGLCVSARAARRGASSGLLRSGCPAGAAGDRVVPATGWRRGAAGSPGEISSPLGCPARPRGGPGCAAQPVEAVRRWTARWGHSWAEERELVKEWLHIVKEALGDVPYSSFRDGRCRVLRLARGLAAGVDRHPLLERAAFPVTLPEDGPYINSDAGP